MDKLAAVERILIALLIAICVISVWQAFMVNRTVQEEVPQNAELHAAATNVASRF
ncbi:MAG TPA: hypothetical protein VNU47_01575 [Candidatus Paceibacterota bacterium]|nr:hypothetical protein [Candidatus Paceibacterota bacterium]